MRKKAPTIYDVARHAGVSVSTVSRVLNGRQSVDSQLRERVQHVMDHLRFRPNRIAQNLYHNRSNVLGCVLPDITNPYFAQLFLELETYAFERGYSVLLGNTASRLELERTYLRTLAEQQVDGILLLGGRTNTCGVTEADVRDVHELVERLPIIAVNGDLPGAAVVSSIKSDEEQGARQLLDLLQRRGHARVAFLGGQADVTSTIEKLRAYREVFADQPQEWTQLTGLTPDAGERALRGVLSGPSRPTAAVCVNDLVAFGVLAAAREHGVKVPEALSVTGFDDISLAHTTFPRLTSVSHNYAQIAREAIDHMIAAIERQAPPRHVSVAPVLVERDSVVCPAGEVTPDAREDAPSRQNVRAGS